MPTWTKKTYKLVCDVLTDTIEDDETRRETTHEFAKEFKKDNPNFSSEAFYEACEVREG